MDLHETNLSFEEALGQLEEVICKLENGSLDLDKALEEFNKGVQLVKECNKNLEAAKEKVKIFLIENGQEIPWESWKE
ncbi:MAG: exodeoxyribonuclease small subunit [Clostridia bacterium]|jgi:exodeoxyribonuclease VII small subunit|nr:exodeoxyribonuclease small subunit [Clostridia bacterium]